MTGSPPPPRHVTVELTLQPSDDLSGWDCGLMVADAVSRPLHEAGIRLAGYRVTEAGRDLGEGHP